MNMKINFSENGDDSEAFLPSGLTIIQKDINSKKLIKNALSDCKRKEGDVVAFVKQGSVNDLPITQDQDIFAFLDLDDLTLKIYNIMIERIKMLSSPIDTTTHAILDNEPTQNKPLFMIMQIDGLSYSPESLQRMSAIVAQIRSTGITLVLLTDDVYKLPAVVLNNWMGNIYFDHSKNVVKFCCRPMNDFHKVNV